MHDSVPISRQVVFHKVDYLIILFMGSSQGYSCFRILDEGLLRLNTAPGITVAGIKGRLLAVSFQAYCVRVNGMKPGESLYS